MRDELHRYANELLADGKWHDYYRVLTALSYRVQPGDAVRRAQSRRVTSKRTAGTSRAEIEKGLKGVDDMGRLVRAGSRHIAAQLLNSARFEHRPLGRPPAGVQKQVRLRRTK